ncbi:Endonuclease/Exonuclease/phosphatase family protein [Rhodobacteraceae bacterium THAF1]|uniref:endonuclease/exonuclease/phosphatase family protein n=1 Tax=Palleronia sp. THAF1 TaxID=2587842 RepID=UPI000F3ED774|nr:endonuclease/exonuclease/phosphatase family protein [Palleronia sp. THAF1]QFU07614.1 Endonuclease/Exonuclease/phosphatase family protein [Palleronia sp. THAF1]VDC22814.1 Endonuclease/Exonuclease/phosphatase family protein [Rhodobacteraceae bacterium THAF1]
MIRVVSYNIRKAVGLDWRRDPMRVARVIAALGADVVALQEADKRLGARPTALPTDALEATGLHIAETGDDGPGIGWHGNAILVRDGIRVRDIERVHLPGFEPRGALIAELITPDGPMTLCATHLGLMRVSRGQQLRVIIDRIGAERMDRAVVAGDMNEWSARTGFEVLEHQMTLLRPGNSFHASRPIACLDRIAHGAAWSAAASGVHADAPANRASDHLPIWADLRPA